jgi:hypothetical protein
MCLLTFYSCDKIPEIINLKGGKDYLVHSWLNLLLWACGGTVHYGGNMIVESIWCLTAVRRQIEKKELGPSVPVKAVPSGPNFLQLGPTS